MTLRRWVSVGVCTLTMAWSTAADAQYTGAINVMALPLPHPSCPNVTTSADGGDAVLDTPAFLCAIDLVPASGGTVYIPAGKYLLDDTLVIRNKAITFLGEGQRISTLVWQATDASGNGIDFDSNTGSLNHTLNVKRLSLLRSAGT